MTWPEPPNYYEAPKHGFKVTLENPTFPIINPDPSISDAGTSSPGLCLSSRPAAECLGGGAGFCFWRSSDLPTLCPAVMNMRTENWGVVTGLAAFGYVAGYYFGKACLPSVAPAQRLSLRCSDKLQ